jgi:polyphosphate kinase
VSVPVAAPINRELSLLDFNRRVLALAQDADVPLLERLRFLCIVGSNLDEFFEIRIAGIKEQLRAKVAPPGLTMPETRELFSRVGEEARALIAEQYRVLNEQVLPALADAGIRLVRRTEFTREEQDWAARYFTQEVRPLLTPIGLDPAHPFPQVVNKSLNFVIELTGQDAFGRDTGIAIVKAPRVLPRIIKLPREVSGTEHAFVMLSSVLHAHLHELFPGRTVANYSQFRVTRDADLWIDEEEVKNLRAALQGELPQRQFGSAVRLEVAAECPEPLAQFLLQQFALTEADLYRCDGPVNIARLSSLVDQVDVDARSSRGTSRPTDSRSTPRATATRRSRDSPKRRPTSCCSI